jgi:hypothetical protein
LRQCPAAADRDLRPATPGRRRRPVPDDGGLRPLWIGLAVGGASLALVLFVLGLVGIWFMASQTRSADPFLSDDREEIGAEPLAPAQDVAPPGMDGPARVRPPGIILLPPAPQGPRPNPGPVVPAPGIVPGPAGPPPAARPAPRAPVGPRRIGPRGPRR